MDRTKKIFLRAPVLKKKKVTCKSAWSYPKVEVDFCSVQLFFYYFKYFFMVELAYTNFHSHTMYPLGWAKRRDIHLLFSMKVKKLYIPFPFFVEEGTFGKKSSKNRILYVWKLTFSGKGHPTGGRLLLLFCFRKLIIQAAPFIKTCVLFLLFLCSQKVISYLKFLLYCIRFLTVLSSFCSYGLFADTFSNKCYWRLQCSCILGKWRRSGQTLGSRRSTLPKG